MRDVFMVSGIQKDRLRDALVKIIDTSSSIGLSVEQCAIAHNDIDDPNILEWAGDNERIFRMRAIKRST